MGAAHLSAVEEWFPDWRGATCVIVASGPSAKDAPLELARGVAKVIAVNTSFKLCPWADALYACDVEWWRIRKGLPEFEGLKISQDIRVHYHKDWKVRLVRTDRSAKGLVLKPKGRIGWGGHGGFHAINLAIQFGAARILLVGFDLRVDQGVHWHGLHPRGLNNPSKAAVERWRLTLDNLAPTFAKIGMDVINCSLHSALKNYPKLSLEDALDAPRLLAA